MGRLRNMRELHVLHHGKGRAESAADRGTEKPQQQIKQTEQFIERFRYKATKARQVQSRIKQLEKLDLIEIEDEEGGSLCLSSRTAIRTRVMELKGIRKSYGGLKSFRRDSASTSTGATGLHLSVSTARGSPRSRAYWRESNRSMRESGWSATT